MAEETNRMRKETYWENQNLVGYFEVDELRQTLATNVMKRMKYHFARYGLPEIVVSDNGSQFSCVEFQNFAEKYDFRHQPSSHGNFQAIGKPEAAVKSADYHQKSSGVRKGCVSGTAWSQEHTHPRTEHKPLRSSSDRKHRKAISTENQRQVLKPLEEGDVVRLQPFDNRKAPWAKGQVIRRLDDRSYEVSSVDHKYRRNRVHLVPTYAS
ncbi:uncharacterized protein LOC134274764 [Saccostrea cucullata]|uniref:uncharacterized protein LOC134274764 n=1 Tax=Saccostrea cuccullata TaxID=36930 RepID=UPI002ED19878